MCGSVIPQYFSELIEVIAKNPKSLEVWKPLDGKLPPHLKTMPRDPVKSFSYAHAITLTKFENELIDWSKLREFKEMDSHDLWNGSASFRNALLSAIPSDLTIHAEATFRALHEHLISDYLFSKTERDELEHVIKYSRIFYWPRIVSGTISIDVEFERAPIIYFAAIRVQYIFKNDFVGFKNYLDASPLDICVDGHAQCTDFVPERLLDIAYALMKFNKEESAWEMLRDFRPLPYEHQIFQIDMPANDFFSDEQLLWQAIAMWFQKHPVLKSLLKILFAFF